MRRTLSHVVGFDDAPFDRDYRGKVPVIGAVFAGLRLEGVLVGRVRRDGADATRELVRLVAWSKFRPQLKLVMLQGIALAGFNVVDLASLHEALGLPVLAVARRPPRMEKIRRALERIPGGRRKWALIEQLGPMERMGAVYVQRQGIAKSAAEDVIERLAMHGTIPEPLRTAHLIAGAIGTGESRGRV